MEKTYAAALERLIKAGENETVLFEKLSRHLAAVGRAKLLPRIARELCTRAARARAAAPVVEIAREEDREPALREAGHLGFAGEVRVNHSLIRGWRAKKSGTLVDRSAKRALVDIYRNITT